MTSAIRREPAARARKSPHSTARASSHPSTCRSSYHAQPSEVIERILHTARDVRWKFGDLASRAENGGADRPESCPNRSRGVPGKEPREGSGDEPKREFAARGPVTTFRVRRTGPNVPPRWDQRPIAIGSSLRRWYGRSHDARRPCAPMGGGHARRANRGGRRWKCGQRDQFSF